MKTGVYKIINLLNNKKYIGSSCNILQRFRQHKHKLSKNRHENSYLQNAWNKYGIEAFLFQIVEICSQDQLESREQFWIDKENTIDDKFGYNLRADASNKYFSQKHRQKISDSLKMYYSMHNHPNLGRKTSLKTRRKISKSNTGKKRSCETRAKIRQAILRRDNLFWQKNERNTSR